MIRAIDAILSLVPNAKCAVSGDQIILWESQETQPTEAEITAEVARLQAEYEAKDYQRKRAAAYPSIADQLDTIYHNGIDAWKAEIAAVKTEYPKP
jgi:predicted lipoprotein